MANEANIFQMLLVIDVRVTIEDSYIRLSRVHPYLPTRVGCWT